MARTAPETPRFFATPAAFRRWLERNHDRATELWLGMHKQASGRRSIRYKEALDEALCFGWIDGVRKRLDEDSFVQRFTPRRPKRRLMTHWVTSAKKEETRQRRLETLIAASAVGHRIPLT